MVTVCDSLWTQFIQLTALLQSKYASISFKLIYTYYEPLSGFHLPTGNWQINIATWIIH